MSEASAPASQGRDIGLDVGRGLLMAWIVIAVHGVFWLSLAPRGPASLFLFEMPPIFIITGAAYFLGEGARDGRLKPDNYLDFLLRRGVRIYVPYLAYVLVAAIIVTVVKWEGGLTLGEAAMRLLSWINPLTFGAGHTWKMLSWHLWFVAPFLFVTALMPFITFKQTPNFVRPWMLAAIAGLVVLAVAQLTLPEPANSLLKNTVSYAFWAMFGFLLAAMPRRWSATDYAIVLALSLIGLAAAATLLPTHVTLDMQHNKFPPNGIFWLFSCAWVAVFLIAARMLKRAQIDALGRSPLLKPFMSAGYSIYLWQGIGYSLAAYAGGEIGASKYLIWLAAIVLTVALGLLFAPLERIRLPKKRA